MTSNILIHPLAVVAMADHFTRVNLGATLLSADSKILGILFGTREEGGKLVINDSIEVDYTEQSGKAKFSTASLGSKRDLHKEVFPLQQVVGFYRCGDEVESNDMQINSDFTAYQTHPVFLLLNTNIATGSKEMPMTIYEATSTGFVEQSYELQSSDSERIAIEHVIKNKKDGANAVAAHIFSLQESVNSMNTRVGVLIDYLEKVEKNLVEPNPVLIKQINNLLTQLPVENGEGVEKQIKSETNDSLNIDFLRTLVKSAAALDEISIMHNKSTEKKNKRI